MPLTTAIPIDFRADAPAPVANTKGSTPRIVLQHRIIEIAVLELDLHRETTGIADALDRRRQKDEGAGGFDCLQGAVQALEDPAQILSPGLVAAAPILEHDIGDAAIWQSRVIVERWRRRPRGMENAAK